MIKVNLAVKRSGTENKNLKAANALLGKLNLEQFKELPIRKLVLPIVVGAFANYMLADYKEKEVSKVSAVVMKLNGEIAKLKLQNEGFKQYESVKKSMDEDEAVIRTKLNTIQKLITDRAAPLKLLLSIAKVIPQDVWLLDLSVNRQEVSMRGNAIDFNQISDFMKGLRESASFQGVDLVDTKQNKEKGAETASFELKAKRR